MAKNYVAHVKEFDSMVPTEPVFFMKHENCIVRNNKPFFLPDFSENIHHEIEIVVKINKVGKNIDKKFANRYFDEIGLGIDFTARDLQKKAKDRGFPWEISKAFDHSAPLSKFLPVTDFEDVNNLRFRLKKNGTTVQDGNTSLMIFPLDVQISYISRYITLKTGDLLFTGTPEGVGQVKVGDHLEAWLEDRKLLDFHVK
jgi:2-keto-4-pentenoate hydratase/2-oxohepta-3-ene-1,7-dioic acid hydratase in catechol pathway